LFGSGADGMPPWVPRLLRQIVVLMVVGYAAWNLARALRGFLTLGLISVFLAVALEPGVAYLAKRGWRRGLAAGVIFFGVGFSLAAFVGLMIPLIIDQVASLVEKLPQYVADLSEFAARFDVDLSTDRLTEAVASLDSSVQSIAGDVAGTLFGVGSRLVSTFFQMLTIGLFTFYITADAPRLRRAVLSVVTPQRQREVLRVMEIAIEKTGGYFYSRTLLALVSAVVTWMVLSAIGIPFALPLGLWVGVLSQFIPVFGTYLGGILPLLIALLEDSVKAIWVAVFILVYQQVENYLIAPRVTARTMSLHPAVAFGSAIVGGTLLGAAGAIMALPVAATVQVFISTYLQRHQLVESSLLDLPPERRKRVKAEHSGEPGTDPE
jgi:predicted PurR-regulated permease PerM